jgi:ankyrin repeat protein
VKGKSRKDPLTGEDPATQRKQLIASNTIAINMLKFLISKKMSLDVKNRDGVTPVHYAIDADCGLDMFKLLIKNGADYKSKSNFGQTPIERNKELGREDIYKYLSGLK